MGVGQEPGQVRTPEGGRGVDRAQGPSLKPQHRQNVLRITEML